MYLAKILPIAALFAALLSIGNATPRAVRLSGGQKVDSFDQFPYYVYISRHDGALKCGGSIISENWVLTSAVCLQGSPRLELSFGKQNEFDQTAGYFSISVNSDQVISYPTGFDDVALIKLPLSLDLVQGNIRAVRISHLTIQEAQDKFAVMPGFNDPASADDSDLRYGMFTIVGQSVCRNRMASFNEYTQLCVQGWGVDQNTPCHTDFGNGLIAEWPVNEQLIGLFSTSSPVCNEFLPAVFTFIPKYLPWIRSITGLPDL